jgi:hypothetical protein
MKTYEYTLTYLKANKERTRYIAGSEGKYVQIMQHTLDVVAYIYEKQPIDVLNDFADVKLDK